MAEIAVQFALQKLMDFLTQEAYFLQGVHERVTSLQEKLEDIRDLFNDIDGKCRKNDAVKRWMGEIREVASDAEDVIDSYNFKIEKRRGEDSARFMGSVRRFARGVKDIPAILQVGKKISDMERRLDEILSNRSVYGIDNILAYGEASSSSSSSNQSHTWREKRAPIVEEADVVGVEDETEKLVRQLTEGDVRRAVISITGMGGIGKTTLAKKVYDDKNVKKTFKFHAWVYVSQEYQVRELLLSIIKCFKVLSRGKWEMMIEEDLQKVVSEYLEGKKYLVVIDDIWTRDAWDGLVSAFPDGKNGSRVLLTTRNEDIARYADPHSTPHIMSFLDENESWELICKKALAKPTPECPPYLEKLGREMVAKCGGLPLAITVLGGVLSRKDKSVKEWEKVLKSVEWWLNESEDRISGILALSYHDLPYYLTPCFLYLGAFPEDSEIDVAELIQLWIAEGFVQQRGGEEMEDVAEDYMNELISRSMIQVSKRKSNGTAEKCRIHDLLRNLSIAKAKEERFLDVYGSTTPTSSTKARRLVISCNVIYISLNRSTQNLRSLLHFNPWFQRMETPVLKSLCAAFKYLKVMDLRNVGLSTPYTLPDEIGSLIHLRYLCLMNNTELSMLPSTITRLSNLQTLNLQSTNIHMLPVDIWKMEQIRHLLLPHGCRINCNTPFHRLNNLQTLSIVEAGSWIEDESENLTNLRELWICGYLNMALSRLIYKLVHLRSLLLEERSRISILAFESFSNHQHLYNMHLSGRLEKLPALHDFPPNLSQICLKVSRLEQDPMGTLEKLPNLRILSLQRESYRGKEMICSVGGFPLLDVLFINGLYELVEWRVEEGAMPNLRCLEIVNCKRLKMLPDGLRHSTTLQELKLEDMSEELKERVRENEGEDWFKFRHIPSLIIT